jgi:hypothetical protein
LDCLITDDCTVSNCGAAIIQTVDSATVIISKIVDDITIGDCRAGMSAENGSSQGEQPPYIQFIRGVAVGDGKTGEYGICIFTVVKLKSPMRLCFCAIAVDYCSSDYIGVIWVCASDGDGLAEKVNVSVTRTGVSSGLNFNNIATICIIDCRLDIIEIRRAIVINGDSAALAGNG